MGPLFLLFSCCTLVGAQTPAFTIRGVSLSIQPASDLLRDDNATLWCRAQVSTSGPQALRHTYTFYKDDTVVLTKNSAGPELAYPLPRVRYANTGKYKCRVEIEGQGKTSDPRKLRVTGLSVPLLQLSRSVLSEGEELTASCSAPDESGAIIFYFFMDGQEILDKRVRSNQVEIPLRFHDSGVHQVHCEYTVMLTPGFIKSNRSDAITVSVRELSFRTVLEIHPDTEVFEGDQLNVSCRLEGNIPGGLPLVLIHGTRLLSSGMDRINSSITVYVQDSEEIECRLEMGNVVKAATKTLSVTELFSVPRLSVSPAEVFQGDKMLLTCSSEVLVVKRLSPQDISYTLETEGQLATELAPGRFSGKAPPYHSNYTCTALARGIAKRSRPLLVRPRVPVVPPTISAVGRVILGRPFQIRCRSEKGSLPIHYTLYLQYEPLNETTVREPHQEALFTATIHQPRDIQRYMCEAVNNPDKEGALSARLNASVIVPLSDATLTVLPGPDDVSEGNTLYLICGVTGTPPITFKWFRKNGGQLLFTGTTNQVSMDHQILGVNRDHSDAYYCEALNSAHNPVRSQMVLVQVRMALWKKGVMAASCLLVLCVAVLLCVLRLKSRRVTVDRPTSSMWSVRPATAATEEETSVGSPEPDVAYTEVVHPQPTDQAKVVLKGTDTVYTQLQKAPPSVAAAAADHEYGSLQYADLKNTDPLLSPDDHRHALPVPVD